MPHQLWRPLQSRQRVWWLATAGGRWRMLLSVLPVLMAMVHFVAPAGAAEYLPYAGTVLPQFSGPAYHRIHCAGKGLAKSEGFIVLGEQRKPSRRVWGACTVCCRLQPIMICRSALRAALLDMHGPRGAAQRYACAPAWCAHGASAPLHPFNPFPSRNQDPHTLLFWNAWMHSLLLSAICVGACLLACCQQWDGCCCQLDIALRLGQKGDDYSPSPSSIALLGTNSAPKRLANKGVKPKIIAVHVVRGIVRHLA